jgi:predicted ATPase
LRAFGALLKRSRRAARLTQAELAERAGYSVVYISTLERGARAPHPTTVALLADALGLSPSELAALQTAAQPPNAPLAFMRRARADADTPQRSVGAFLGALPTGPLVGRERELDLIESALEAVSRGQGRLLLLVGEPGVGKTRLAQEIALRARAHDFRVLTGRCYEPQQTLAYSPFLEALTQAVPLLEAGRPTSLAERWPEVARLLPEQLPEQLPDHLVRASASALQDDTTAQQRLCWQVSGLLGTLSVATPLAVLLDDLHWADRASLDLLPHLARQTHERPILLVGTAREVEAGRERSLATVLTDLRREELLERVVVPPLGAEETSALIGMTLGGALGATAGATTISSELAARIYAGSEGNAFFTRQLAHALREHGDLLFEEEQWRLSATSASRVEAPESIRAVIGQRLSRLTPHTQEVLREASVLGQRFDFRQLQRLGGRGEQEVEEALEEAGQAGIVREGTGDQYHFNHVLTCDTLYAELSARRRLRLRLRRPGAQAYGNAVRMSV